MHLLSVFLCCVFFPYVFSTFKVFFFSIIYKNLIHSCSSFLSYFCLFFSLIFSNFSYIFQIVKIFSIFSISTAIFFLIFIYNFRNLFFFVFDRINICPIRWCFSQLIFILFSVSTFFFCSTSFMYISIDYFCYILISCFK